MVGLALECDHHAPLIPKAHIICPSLAAELALRNGANMSNALRAHVHGLSHLGVAFKLPGSWSSIYRS
jgi:hypothetical protein